MAKSGQARVPTTEQQGYLFEVIQQHRHPEKNTAIMQMQLQARIARPGDRPTSD